MKENILFSIMMLSCFACAFFAFGVIGAILGTHRSADMFWYGMGLIVSGVILKSASNYL